MKKYIDLLDSSNLFGWKIVEIQKKATELYYILDKLETNRATMETLYNVTIYVKENNKIGASTFDIYPYMDNEEIMRKIEYNKSNAKYALNDYYELPKYEHLEPRKKTTNLSNEPLKVLEEVKDAIFSIKSDAYLSATEFFLIETDERLINSNGIDVKQKTYRLNIELYFRKENEGNCKYFNISFKFVFCEPMNNGKIELNETNILINGFKSGIKNQIIKEI